MNITKCSECGSTKNAEDRASHLEVENARLQADVKEARQHWRACEEGWNKVIKQAEGFLRERDRYKALAERCGEALNRLTIPISLALNAVTKRREVVITEEIFREHFEAPVRAALADLTNR